MKLTKFNLSGVAVNFPHPSMFFPELSDRNLLVIATRLLDVRFNTLQELQDPLDDAYTREATCFGRSRNMLIQLTQSGLFEWLSLSHGGMDVTFKIGQVPCRFFRDDVEVPGKPGFFKRNVADNLFSVDKNEPVVFRFIVEGAQTADDEDHVFFVGYNAHLNRVTQWVYRSSTPTLHSVDQNVPQSVMLPPPEVGLRDTDSAPETNPSFGTK